MGNLINSLLLLPFIVFFLFNTLSISLAKSCHPVDEEALLDFKRRITADHAQAFNTWSSTKDCCDQWTGVYCDRVGDHLRVTQLGGLLIIDGTVSGTLSPFLGNLTYLESLDVSDFQNLTGPIPAELGKLSNLIYLDLGNNQLSGSIPSSLGQLKKLKQLYLSYNNLSGIIPEQIFQTSKVLTVVELSHNQLSGPLPSSMSECTSLTYLDLNNNHLSGVIPRNIGNLKKLREFWLSYNSISGSIPPSIGNLASLETLLFNHNNLSGSIPEKILNLKELHEFNVSKNRLTGKIPPHKADLPASGFLDNPGLCDAPLPPCSSKHQVGLPI